MASRMRWRRAVGRIDGIRLMRRYPLDKILGLKDNIINHIELNMIINNNIKNN
jgi:hypothetical protein